MKAAYRIKIKFDRDMNNGMNERRELFSKFLNEIPHTNPIDTKEIKKICNKFDVCITGSDQVWHPGIWNDAYLLRFAHHKVAYAASVGVTVFTNAQKRELEEALKGYSAISVRERGVTQMIQKLTTLRVQEVLDPTLLYMPQDWEKIMCPIEITKPYVFMYAIDNHPAFRRHVYEYCQSRKFQLVTIPFNQSHYKISDMRYTDRPLYAVGPRQWIWLIKNAEMVFTDSFHGTAFCVQFKKDFWSFEAPCGKGIPNDTKRIFSLLSKFSLQERIIDFNEFPDAEKISERIDYSGLDKCLSKLRNESTEFLEQAIKL